MMRFLLLACFVASPIAINADDLGSNDALQAYKERLKARKAEALSQRARNNANKPRAVYQGRSFVPSTPGLAKPTEMVYSISQGRLVPARYQRVAVPTGFVGGYNVTVVPTRPADDATDKKKKKKSGMSFQQGDQFRRNANGTITVFRRGVPIGQVVNGRIVGGKK